MGGDWSYLTDEALREEIELVGDLVVAASACPGRMAQDDVDSVLGLCGRADFDETPALSRRPPAAARTR